MNNKPRNPKAVPDGIDLRDYFAAKAMQAVTMHYLEQWLESGYESGFVEYGADESISGIAYEIADAMLAERERDQ